MELLEAALQYQAMDLSIIPIQKNKKPYIKWEKYQKEKASIEQVKKWWGEFPDANVGIVTGKISDLLVIDIDSQEGMDEFNELIPENILTPIATTPRGGWHYYFHHNEGITVGTKFIKDCDFRGEGGYIIAPPSTNGNGKQYKWTIELGIELAIISNSILTSILTSTSIKRENSNSIERDTALQGVTKRDISFEKGNRDEALFHLANYLVKGGMKLPEVEQYLVFFASHTNPPYPQNELKAKIQSALDRDTKRENTSIQEIKDWISVTEGDFCVTELDKECDFVTKRDKTNRRQIIKRLVDSNIIERVGTRNGYFRRIDTDIEAMDFMNSAGEGVKIWLPFEIWKDIEIYPGNIIVIAGQVNSGKTALMLNLIQENMNKWNVHYFNSEMGGTELRKRLLKTELPLESWKFKAWERAENFADVIVPGEGNLNLIDFLEMHENFYLIGQKIFEIHKKLDGAIAVIAIQKPPGRDEGVGGNISLEKPRLYLSVGNGVCKIVKAKNWKGNTNPNGQEIHFKLVNGYKLIENF